MSKVEQIRQKLAEQKTVAQTLKNSIQRIKQEEEAIKRAHEEAKKRTDWMELCREHGINPESSYNTFKRNT